MWAGWGFDSESEVTSPDSGVKPSSPMRARMARIDSALEATGNLIEADKTSRAGGWRPVAEVSKTAELPV